MKEKILLDYCVNKFRFAFLAKSASQSNGLSRSRRSHFSRKDSTPEAASNTTNQTIVRQKSEVGNSNATNTETSKLFQF